MKVMAKAGFLSGCWIEEGSTSEIKHLFEDFSFLSYGSGGFSFLMAVGQGCRQCLESARSFLTHGMP